MADLSSVDFIGFFKALWGKTPFAWQRALVDRVLTGEDNPWPQAIALPTAAGKTACIDIAVFALAAQAGRLVQGDVVTAPRRIFLAVDRRLIVDAAYDRANFIATKLQLATGGMLKIVADALRLIARGGAEGADGETPLTVHTLRGGMYRSESWARSPLQPAVIASTVDQLGSRLLFRAYGRGPGMWPVYAGLAANDSLILLDEAHCARPFLQTLHAVARFRGWAEFPLGRAFQTVVLSATPPPGLAPFVDSSDEPRDREHPLGRRQLAHKPARLQVEQCGKGRNGTEKLAKAMAGAAQALVSEQRRAIVIFVNRVATARAVRDRLKEKYADRVRLLTGRMRAVDKDEVVSHQLASLLSAESERRRLDEPVFVVATQTLEVGADLDFDALVTECASLDALRQRFGRLNRMGRPIEACAVIVVRGGQAADSVDDPVYGVALANTWTWLKQVKDATGEVDFGINHLQSILPAGDELDRLNAPSGDAPVMLPAHVDCWAQTMPAPLPTPDVALFLHGQREGAADVNICWRVNLDLDAMNLCPPASSETLSVPIGVFKRWLSGQLAEDPSSDVEGAAVDLEAARDQNDVAGDARQVLRWRGSKTSERDLTGDPGAIRPGDILILPVDAPGATTLGDLPDTGEASQATLDVGSRAYLTARAKPLLRLHPNLIGGWPNGEAKARARALLASPDDDPAELLRAVREMLQALEQETEGLQAYGWLHLVAGALLRESRRKVFLRALHWTEDDYLTIAGRTLIPALTRQADTFSDENDASASGTSGREGRPVRLRDHLPGVEAFADRFARGCGLPEELVQAVAKAGLLHDLGKIDPRFQALLQGGNRFAVGVEPLAKSGAMPKTRAAREVARKASGYPPSGRHELLSVRLAESAPALLPDDPDLRDLVLYLIGIHHGHCRPFAPVVFGEEAPQVFFELQGHHVQWQGNTGLERLDSGVSQRFWRLTKRYGWWGLAWLEALLRLADHRRSEWEETHYTGGES